MFNCSRRSVHTFLGMLSMAIPLILGQLFHNNWLSVMACFGALLLMNYVPANQEKTIDQIILIDLLALTSFLISIILAAIPWVGLVWIGVLAFTVQYLMAINHYVGPGGFFLLMINGMLTSLSALPFKQRFMLVVFALIGTLISALLILFENYRYEKYPINPTNIRWFAHNRQVTIKALNYASFAFIAYYCGYNLHLPNYYWVLVAAITVLQSENVATAKQRQQHYVLAAIIGCTASLAIYLTIDSVLILSVLAVVLMGLICFTMPKSYLLGNFFTTPIALILFKLLKPESGLVLVRSRILSILLGTLIGVIGIMLYEYQTKQIEPESI